jgi:hypothetical protein
VSGDLLRRLEQKTLLVLAVCATALLIYRPSQPALALGVLGGGVLVGVAYWAIRGAVDSLTEGAVRPGNARKSTALALVKFFTRHAILALTGYGMMTRLDLHPVGMLLGVAAPGVAAALEAIRAARRS